MRRVEAEPSQLGILWDDTACARVRPKATQARKRSRWTSLHPPLPVPKRRAALVRRGSQVRLGDSNPVFVPLHSSSSFRRPQASAPAGNASREAYLGVARLPKSLNMQNTLARRG